MYRPNLKRSGKGKLRNELVGAHELENLFGKCNRPRRNAENSCRDDDRHVQREVQLSQRDRATLRFTEYFAKSLLRSFEMTLLSVEWVGRV